MANDYLAFVRQTAAADPLSIPCPPDCLGRVMAWLQVLAVRFDLEGRLVLPAIEAAKDAARAQMAAAYRDAAAPAGDAPAAGG
jgi:DNA-binding FadR family transcriptional regulator